ncbi:hypothetical protein CHS0354_016038 [Potamilus streckersoni]|uniref:Peptidase M12B domain-containing protein n=1 Tax=Potamilus streckersoni TaxID=2493646 RepID=A0AAE0RQ34_9BIVA|nr:hypothetical protein CHS0354_016038 [Potamilus streckersoni]
MWGRHDLFEESIEANDINGLSSLFGICIPGRRVSLVQGGDYFETVRTAVHELGHNIGADHDGEGLSVDCPEGEYFIMDPDIPLFDPGESYSKTPWMFSKCSVRTFKIGLKTRNCLTNPGIFFDNEEWKNYAMKLPGERYTPKEQCQFINGPTSEFCGDVSENICLQMQCKDPKTGKCNPIPVTAHIGTRCGENKWCKKGKCVEKSST